MARLRKNETSVNITTSGASPARRKASEAPRKRAAGQSAAARNEQLLEEEIAAPAYLAELPTEAVIASAVESAVAVPLAQEDIATLAYTYWVERGYTDGNPEQDWLRAEAELRERAPVTL